MENNSKKRKTNIELLRILSMILIILHHYVAHGGLSNTNGIFLNKFIGEVIYIGGKVGVTLFVLISGYFLVNSKFKIRKLIKLILEVFFYSITIYLILILTNSVEFSIKTLIKDLLPISYGKYWFITCYIGLYIFSPFINNFINSMEKDHYRIFIIVGAICFVLIPMLTPKNKWIYSEFAYFVYLYILAGYIKKYNFKYFSIKKNCVLTIILMVTLMTAISILFTFLEQYNNIFEKGIFYLDKFNSITILILSISIFEIFLKLEIKERWIISILGKCSFAVYLIHDNNDFKKIMWEKLKTNYFIYENSIKLLIHMIVTTIIIYTICSIIEIIRLNTIEKLLDNIHINKLDMILNKIDKKMNNEN